MHSCNQAKATPTISSINFLLGSTFQCAKVITSCYWIGFSWTRIFQKIIFCGQVKMEQFRMRPFLIYSRIRSMNVRVSGNFFLLFSHITFFGKFFQFVEDKQIPIYGEISSDCLNGLEITFFCGSRTVHFKWIIMCQSSHSTPSQRWIALLKEWQ